MQAERLPTRRIAIIGMLAVAACGGASPGHSPRVPSVAVRSCGMVGFGGLRPGWRHSAGIYGPLAIASLRDLTPQQGPPGRLGDRYGAYELIAVVNAGADPALSLPRSEWSTVGLIYDPAKFRSDGAYRIEDLDQVVRFRACKSPRFNHGVSQFDGGFVVSHRQCVHFLVRVTGGSVYHGQFPAAAPCPRHGASGLTR